MVGSIKNRNYRVLVSRISKMLEPTWKETYGEEPKDFEGQGIVPYEDGYLICGCSEGYASESGGKDWKAYLLKISKNGDKIWEKSYRIMGNECAYSIVTGGGILLFGGTSSSSREHFFLLKTDNLGDIVWQKILGKGEDSIPGGIILTGTDYILAGSLRRNEEWHLYLSKVDNDGVTKWEKTFKDKFVLDICKVNDGIAMTGKKGDDIFLIKIDNEGQTIWEKTFDKGCGVTLEEIGAKLLIGGDVEKDGMCKPVLFKTNHDGILEWQRIYETEGFIETMLEIRGGYILVRHGLTPREHTEIIEVDEEGNLK